MRPHGLQKAYEDKASVGCSPLLVLETGEYDLCPGAGRKSYKHRGLRATSIVCSVALSVFPARGCNPLVFLTLILLNSKNDYHPGTFGLFEL